MFTKLRLERFKSFKDAELSLGPFTVIVGANATGKSNIRDAFRFLHGVVRGYTMAEILGEKWVEGGFLQWSGIRGGVREATFERSATFTLGLGIAAQVDADELSTYAYELEVAVPEAEEARIESEALRRGSTSIFESVYLPHDETGRQLWVPEGFQKLSRLLFLSQFHGANDEVDEAGDTASAHLSSIRFVDLHPDAMRRPSIPGQTVLGDRGENLSSVLLAICRDVRSKGLLTEWLHELLPGDVVDFEFPQDLQGKVLVTLVEANGRKISAYSASDGTLRFLGMLAALLGPEPARFFFLEEIENGIHPSRLNLLIQLIEQVTAERGIQVVATTHSPLVLALLSEQSLEHASVTYRLEGQPDTRIRRLLDIPHAREVLAQSSAAHLHESGWFEDALSFTADDAEQEHAA